MKYTNLFEKGCSNFQIEDKNLLEDLKKLATHPMFRQENWKNLRFCRWGMQFINNEEAMDFIDTYKDFRHPSQVYFQQYIQKDGNQPHIERVMNTIKKWTSEAYDIDETKINEPHLQLNVMPDGFHIRNHRDGGDGGLTRLVATLIYMNDNWNESNGGELVIHGGEEVITPTFGKVVMIDLTKHDIEHAVNLVKDMNRHAIVSFVSKS
jgi:Rps23 Pro-64 3,4-dihydroxylase Tpa1-like proline 4-hydroxylase